MPPSNSDQAGRFETVCTNVRVSIATCKEPVPLLDFEDIYFGDHHQTIPYDELGFSSIREFFETIPDIVALVKDVNGKVFAKYVQYDKLQKNRAMVLRTDFDTTKETKPQRPVKQPVQPRVKMTLTDKRQQSAPQPEAPRPLPTIQHDNYSHPRQPSFTKDDFIELVRRWNNGAEVSFAEISNEIMRRFRIDLSDLTCKRYRLHSISVGVVIVYHLTVGNLAILRHFREVAQRYQRDHTLRRVLNVGSNTKGGAINAACKDEIRAVARNGELLLQPIDGSIYAPSTNSSDRYSTTSDDVNSAISSTSAHSYQRNNPPSYPQGSQAQNQWYDISIPSYDYDYDTPSSYSELPNGRDDLNRLYEEGDKFVDVNSGPIDEIDEQVQYLIKVMDDIRISPLITDVPKMLSTQFNIDPSDFPAYDESLMAFVQQLVDRSDSMLMLKYINNMAFLTLSLHHNDVTYKTLPLIETPDLLTTVDDVVLNERVDANLNDHTNLTKSCEWAEFVENRKHKNAKMTSNDDCKVM